MPIVILHLLLFLLAVVVFYLGLGMGLQVNSTLGSALWVTAAAIAFFNIVWIVQRIYRAQK